MVPLCHRPPAAKTLGKVGFVHKKFCLKLYTPLTYILILLNGSGKFSLNVILSRQSIFVHLKIIYFLKFLASLQVFNFASF